MADTGNHRIQVFSDVGTFLRKWGGEGSGEGELNGPSGLAIDSTRFVYVADAGNHRVQKFDSNGAFIGTWGTEGTGDGQFSSPQGVLLDESGFVYVVDTGNNRIQKFTTNGVNGGVIMCHRGGRAAAVVAV